nr:DsbA family protein [Desulforhopalus singaporensis]
MEKLEQSFDLKATWRAFPLHPDTPSEGRLLEELFNTTPEKIGLLVAGLQATAKSLGLPFGERTRSYNSRLVQELGIWAEDKGCGHKFHLSAFTAYFSDGLNLADREVALNIAVRAGLPQTEAVEIITDRLYQERVDLDWAEAAERTVTAVPTFFFSDRRVVGAQSYETLANLARLCKVPEKSTYR